MAQVPVFWSFMMETLFQLTNPRLVVALWENYPTSSALLYTLRQCGESAPSSLVARQRVKQVSALLEPAWLMRAAEKVNPPGQPRPREICAFEERVLQLTGPDGKFLWSAPTRKDGHGPGKHAEAHSLT